MTETSSSLEGRCITFVTDCNNNRLRSTDILSAAPGTARKLQIDEFPPDLQAVISGWGSLPEALRAAIVQVVEMVTIIGSD